MRKEKIKKVLVLSIIAMFTVSATSGIASEVVNIVGEVNDSYQLVDGNGQVYEIANTTQGNLLVEEHIGEKVKVTGTIEKNDDYLLFFVTSFQTLAE